MAGIAITALPTVTLASLADIVPAVSGGITSQETWQQVLNLFSLHSSSIQWNSVVGTTQQMTPGSGYVNTNSSLCTFTLPSQATFGTEIVVQGFGSGGWSIAQNAGQNIQIGSSSSTIGVGGSVSSSNRYDSVRLVCVVANTTWCAVGAPEGTLTVV